jgi:hypothetical protein
MAARCFVEAAAAMDLSILTADYQRQQNYLKYGTLEQEKFSGR